MTERLSQHILYTESIRSDAAERLGLDNTPDDEQLEAMQQLADNIFEPLRTYMRRPIAISSFFRSEVVNRTVGGSPTSQHLKGEAIDIHAPAKAEYTNADLFYAIIKLKLPFDQLIWEYGNSLNPDWIHVSYNPHGKQRKAILRAVKENGKTVYKPFKL